MIPVEIIGTSITYSVDPSVISFESRRGNYHPGNIIHHPSLGKIRCEEIQFGINMQPTKIKCSIVDDTKK